MNSNDNHLAIQEITKIRNELSQEIIKNIKQKNLRSDKKPIIDISVVTYNSEKWVQTFCESVKALNYPQDKIHLYFVDNNSSDDTVALLESETDALKKQGISVTLIKQKNLGFGAGNNRGIKAGSAEFCLVTNIDLTFEPNSLKEVVTEACHDNLRIAAWELRQVPYEHPKYYDPVSGITNWNSHACVLLRRSAFEKVGGYDKKIFMYGEDVELSYKLRKAGYLLKYCPKATVTHYTYENFDQIKPLQFFGSISANVYLRLKYGHFKDKLAAFYMSAKLCLKPLPTEISKKNLVKQIALSTIKAIPEFRLLKNANPCYFPFRCWDYEMTRDGADFKVIPPTSFPLVSVITRTYPGRESFLIQAMKTVANQTWKNIEYIVVEDSDGAMKDFISAASEQINQKISYLANGVKGRSSAGNAGLAAAKGKFCLFLDDDDLLFADHIEVLMQALMNNPKTSAAYSLAWEVVTDYNLANKNYLEYHFQVPHIHKQVFCRNALKEFNYIPIQSILFEKELYHQHGGFDEDLDVLEDWFLWNNYASTSDFVYVPKLTSLYRVPHDKNKQKTRNHLFQKAYPLVKEKIAALS